MDDRKEVAGFLLERYREEYPQRMEFIDFALGDDDLPTEAKLLYLKVIAQQDYAEHPDYNTDWMVL